jgi:hypothetical protein
MQTGAGSDGSATSGGAGGDLSSGNFADGGGGGGGGLMGGGGGGTEAVLTGAGGGGGSSLAPTGGTVEDGACTGDGFVAISFTPAPASVTAANPATPAQAVTVQPRFTG